MDRTASGRFELFLKGWRRLAIVGIVTMSLGFLSIMASFAATLTTVYIVGAILLCGGIVYGIQSFSMHGESGFLGHLLAAGLYVLAGTFMLTHPIAGAASLTLVAAMLLAVEGLFQGISALALRYNNWGWECLSGTISLCLAFVIFTEWPSSSLWVIGTFIGIDLVFRGWSALMLALAARQTAGEIRERLRVGRDDRRAGPMDRRIAVLA